MKNSPILFALLLGLVPGHGGLSGQNSRLWELQRPDFPKPVLQLDSTAFAAPSWNRRVLTGLAGAVLGAGLGYFASRSSWEIGNKGTGAAESIALRGPPSVVQAD